MSHQYDANGSLIEQDDNGSIRRYGYDITGRLSEVRDGSDKLIVQYRHDPFGRRYKKSTPSGTTYYLYSDEGLIAEADDSGTLTRQYGWKPDGMWGTDPLYLLENGQAYFYQTDHLGTPQQMVGVNGAVVLDAQYESFWQAHVGVKAVDNPLRFPGQYFYEETGLYYNWYRYYDPQAGRYITSDPIGLQGGLNTYVYGNNNPAKFTDIYGLDANDGSPNPLKQKSQYQIR